MGRTVEDIEQEMAAIEPRMRALGVWLQRLRESEWLTADDRISWEGPPPSPERIAAYQAWVEQEIRATIDERSALLVRWNQLNNERYAVLAQRTAGGNAS
jgi:hypothetical protein